VEDIQALVYTSRKYQTIHIKMHIIQIGTRSYYLFKNTAINNKFIFNGRYKSNLSFNHSIISFLHCYVMICDLLTLKTYINHILNITKIKKYIFFKR